MKSLLLISSFLIFGFTTNLTSDDDTNVYICDSETATKYHLKKDCRGLNACKVKVVKIALKEAKKEKKKLCGWED